MPACTTIKSKSALFSILLFISSIFFPYLNRTSTSLQSLVSFSPLTFLKFESPTINTLRFLLGSDFLLSFLFVPIDLRFS